MSDITTIWNVEQGMGDYLLAGAALAEGDELQTAMIISLFSDRVAAPTDRIPDGTNDPRGWACDTDDLAIGSRLWLLDRSKQTDAVLNQAKDYITEAVQWMIDDQFVERFDITVEWTRRSMLGCRVVAYRKVGTQLIALRYAYVWEQN